MKKSGRESSSSGNSANIQPLVENELDPSLAINNPSTSEIKCNLSCSTSQESDNGPNQGNKECNCETYKSGGIKNVQHGALFQTKISLILAMNLSDNGRDFKMAPEMETADKFDDSVIFLREQNGTRMVLVQAKHRLYPNKSRIKYQDLLKSDGDFSLIKYLLSYKKVLREPHFNDKEKQFVICTNTSFDLTSFKNGDLSLVVQDIKREHIFYIEDTLSKQSKGKMHKIKINENSSFINILQGTLLRQIKENKSLQKLIKVDLNKEEFYSKLSNTKECRDNNEWNEIRNQLKNKFRTDDVIKKEELLDLVDLFSIESHLKKWIFSFFENTVFITEYPDEIQLTDILKQKLISQPDIQQLVDWLDQDLLFNSWQQDHLHFQGRFENAENKLARFICNNDWKHLLNYWLNKCFSLSVASISRAEAEMIKKLSIEFKDFVALTEFLKSEEQVCYLKTESKNPRLGTVKTLKHLTEPHNYIFSPLDNIKVDKLRELILRSFSSAASNHLLVIECPQVSRDETKEQLICREIAEILRENKRKKVVIISSTEFSLVTSLINCFSSRKIYVDDSFKDLTHEGQINILQRRICLQGEEVSLDDLMEKSLASKTMNQSMLLGLLDGEIIEVGNKIIFNSVGCKQFCYVPRCFYQQFEFNNLGVSEKYFITGLSPEELTGLGIEAKICKNEGNYTYYDNGFVLSSRGIPDYLKHFENTSYSTARFWEDTYNQCVSINLSQGIKVNRLLYDQESKKLKKLVREEDFYKPEQKVLVITGDSGMGKSTVLSKLAIELKKQSLSHWVIRINLNDFADKSDRNSLDEIDFVNHKISKAVQFLVDMVFKNDSSELHDFQKKLLKETLDGHKGSKLKIFVMFDGFDEIVPAYKKKTITLIKAIKASNVSHIIVTTRLSEMQDLEQELETQAWSISPFANNEQVQYLNKFLQFKLSPEKSNAENEKLCTENYLTVRDLLNKLNEVKLLPIFELMDLKSLKSLVFEKSLFDENFDDTSREYERRLENFNFLFHSWTLIESWRMLIETENNFLANPLLLNMLAEVMIKEGFAINNRLKIPELYGTFINMKFEIYEKEKKKQIHKNQATDSSDLMLSFSFEKVYCMLAFKMFFPNNIELAEQQRDIEVLGSKFKENNKSLYQEISRVGIVTFLASENLQFIHRSFAEYYLGKCISNYLGSRQGIQNLFVKEILFSESFLIATIVLDVINSHLTEKKIDLLVYTDMISPAYLFLAINRNCEGIFLFLLECIKRNNVPNAALLPNFILRGETVLHQAAGTDFFLNILNWFKQNLSQTEFRELLLMKNSSKVTFFHNFIHFNKTNKDQVLEFLRVNLGIEDFVRELILEQDQCSESILHIVFKNFTMWKEWKAFLNMITNKLDINYLRDLFILRDYYGSTILHILAMGLNNNNNICEVLNYLEDKIENFLKELIFIKNNQNQTFLQVFVQFVNQFRCLDYEDKQEHKCKRAYDLIQILKFLNCYLDPSDYEKLLLADDQDGENIIHVIVRIRSYHHIVQEDTSSPVRVLPCNFVLELFDYLREESSSLFNNLIHMRNNKQQTILHIIVINTVNDCDREYLNNSEDKDYNCWGLVQYLRGCLDESKWMDLLGARDNQGDTIFHIIIKEDSYSLLRGFIRSFCLDNDHFEELIKIKNNEQQTVQDLVTSERFHLNILNDELFYTQ